MSDNYTSVGSYDALKKRAGADEDPVWVCPQCGTGMYKKDLKEGWGKTHCKECGAPRPS